MPKRKPQCYGGIVYQIFMALLYTIKKGVKHYKENKYLNPWEVEYPVYNKADILTQLLAFKTSWIENVQRKLVSLKMLGYVNNRK